MAHTFKAEEMPDAERARRAAEWIETGIQDFRRALDLTAGRVAEQHVRNSIDTATQLAQSFRQAAEWMALTPKE